MLSMKNKILVITLLGLLIAVPAYAFLFEFFGSAAAEFPGLGGSGSGPSSDGFLLETSDYGLLESGDFILLE